MSLKNMLLITILAVIVIVGLQPVIQGAEEGQSPPGYRKITPKEAQQRLANEKNIILLDVRTQEEYTERHIPGSLLLPLDQLEQKASTVIPVRKAVIFVYCRSGRRSAIAAGLLVKLGYTAVFDLGGISDWPYQTVSTDDTVQSKQSINM